MICFFIFPERRARRPEWWRRRQEIRRLRAVDFATRSHGVPDHGHLLDGKPAAAAGGGQGRRRGRARKLKTQSTKALLHPMRVFYYTTLVYSVCV